MSSPYRIAEPVETPPQVMSIRVRPEVIAAGLFAVMLSFAFAFVWFALSEGSRVAIDCQRDGGVRCERTKTIFGVTWWHERFTVSRVFVDVAKNYSELAWQHQGDESFRWLNLCDRTCRAFAEPELGRDPNIPAAEISALLTGKRVEPVEISASGPAPWPACAAGFLGAFGLVFVPMRRLFARVLLVFDPLERTLHVAGWQTPLRIDDYRGARVRLTRWRYDVYVLAADGEERSLPLAAYAMGYGSTQAIQLAAQIDAQVQVWGGYEVSGLTSAKAAG